jgi:hypothetical protein
MGLRLRFDLMYCVIFLKRFRLHLLRIFQIWVMSFCLFSYLVIFNLRCASNLERNKTLISFVLSESCFSLSRSVNRCCYEL